MIRNFCLLLLISLSTSCASQVFTDFDPEHSFAGYKTFSWVSDQPMLVEGERGPNPLVADRLKTAVKNGFEGKGYEFASDASAADFVVSFTVGARDKIDIREHEVEEYFGPYDLRWRRDPFGYMGPRSTTTVVETREYTEGTLAIDVFDVQDKKPVWHSGTKRRLTESELQSVGPEVLGDAVAAILANFPPDAIQN